MMFSPLNGLRSGIKTATPKTFKKNTFHLRYKPPMLTPEIEAQLLKQGKVASVAEPIVLVGGSYVDAYASTTEPQAAHHMREHNAAIFNAAKRTNEFRTFVCSAGTDPHNPKPCIGCYETEHGAKMAARDQWSFNIVHLVWYHKVPLEKDGRVITKEGNKEPVLIHVQCTGTGCENCKKNHTKTWGMHKYLQVGKNHLENMFAWDARIGSSCANCGTLIMQTGFKCGSCDSHYIDTATCGWDDDTLSKFANSAVTCESCKKTGQPVPEVSCGYLDGNGTPDPRGCKDNKNPKRLSLFDVVLYVQRQGEGKDSKMLLVTSIPVESFPTPDKKPLKAYITELVKEPFDFEAIHSLDSLEEQAAKLNVANPYANVTAPNAPPSSVFSSYPGLNPPPMPMPMGMPIPGRPSF